MACEVALSISFATPLRVIAADEPAGRQFLTTTFGSFVITTEGEHVMYTLPIDKQVTMQVSYVDSKGNPAVVDGEVTWASSNPAILTVTADPGDSSMATAVPVGAVGQAQVTATADADLGSGVRELVTLADIDVVAGEAVAGTISPVGEPVPVP